MSTTTNKGYDLQSTGSNNGTWGVDLNSNFSIIDTNLGGQLDKDCSGSSNITLNSTEAENFYHNCTGTLTGNIKYIVPNKGSFYCISNNTSGAFTFTVVSDALGTGVAISQGTTAFVYVKAGSTAVVLCQSSTTSTVTVPNGGTGATTLAAHGVVIGNGTSAVNVTSAGTSGQLFISNGASADPTFQNVPTWAVNQGGTGQTSYTDGQLLIGNSSGTTLSKATLTAGSGIAITNGHGSITIATTGSSGGITLLTPTAASGTSVTFTGIPSTAKRVKVLFKGISLNGASDILVKVGAGSIASTGYNSAGSRIGSSTGTATSSAGFVIGVQGTSSTISGSLSIDLLDSSNFIWSASGTFGDKTGSITMTSGGDVTLSGNLDRVSITTVTGSPSFDAGTFNVAYE